MGATSLNCAPPSKGARPHGCPGHSLLGPKEQGRLRRLPWLSGWPTKSLGTRLLMEPLVTRSPVVVKPEPFYQWRSPSWTPIVSASQGCGAGADSSFPSLAARSWGLHTGPTGEPVTVPRNILSSSDDNSNHNHASLSHCPGFPSPKYLQFWTGKLCFQEETRWSEALWDEEGHGQGGSGTISWRLTDLLHFSVVVTLDYPVSLDFRWVGNLPYNPISLMGPKEVTDTHRFSLLLV